MRLNLKFFEGGTNKMSKTWPYFLVSLSPSLVISIMRGLVLDNFKGIFHLEFTQSEICDLFE